MSDLLWNFWQACHAAKPEELDKFQPQSLNEELARRKAEGDFAEQFDSRFEIFKLDQAQQLIDRLNDSGTRLQPDALAVLLEHLCHPNFISNLIAEQRKHGHMQLPGLSSPAPARLWFNLVIHDSNYLRVHDQALVYYIVQYNQQIALVFPTEACILELDGVSRWVLWCAQKTMHVLLIEYVKQYDLLKKHLSQPSSFCGYLVGNERPYHYFYDQLYGLEWIHARGLLSSEAKVYQANGSSFCPISSVYELSGSDVCNEFTTINRTLLQNAEFVVSPSLRYSSGQDEKILGALDHRLQRWANKCPPKDVDSLQGSGPLIWLGICSEKRNWIEALDGFSQILCRIHQTHPDLCVVLDGWTNTLQSSRKSLAGNRKDIQFAQRLINRLPPRMPVINLIGRHAQDKIFWAQKVDLFITHYATDTLYVSRICGRPGVTFGSKTTGPRMDNQVHATLYEVPQECVTDIASAGVSAYSIRWEELYELVLQLWDEQLAGRYKTPTASTQDNFNWQILGHRLGRLWNSLWPQQSAD